VKRTTRKTGKQKPSFGGRIREFGRRTALGPLAASDRVSLGVGVGVSLVLTALTQLGGLIVWPMWGWLELLGTGHPSRWGRALRTLGLAGVWYTLAALFAVPLVAGALGRVRLPLAASPGLPLAPQSAWTVVLLRNYLERDAAEGLRDVARRRHRAGVPGEWRYLDAGFPLPWTPMLPHADHRDGRQVDLALVWSGGPPPSPIGYFAYASPDPAATLARERACQAEVAPVGAWPRSWDFDALQALWRHRALDTEATAQALRAAAASTSVIAIRLEPTVRDALAPIPKSVPSTCRDSRADDHVHLTLQ
jgi:hypothetical protein